MPAECTSSAKLCLYVTRFVNSVYCRFCAPLSIHVWCSGALPMHTDEKYLKNGTFILAKKFYGVNFSFLVLTMSMSFGKQKQYAFYFNEFCSVIQGFLKKKISAVCWLYRPSDCSTTFVEVQSRLLQFAETYSHCESLK